jgi:hypothetical protein
MDPSTQGEKPMTTLLTREWDNHFRRRGHGAPKELRTNLEPEEASAPPDRLARVARLMALALRFEMLLRNREVASYAELARLGHVSCARISQILNLLHLAPDLQEELLFLTRKGRGRDPIHLARLQQIVAQFDWAKQRRLWRELLTATGSAGVKDPVRR